MYFCLSCMEFFFLIACTYIYIHVDILCRYIMSRVHTCVVTCVSVIMYTICTGCMCIILGLFSLQWMFTEFVKIVFLSKVIFHDKFGGNITTLFAVLDIFKFQKRFGHTKTTPCLCHCIQCTYYYVENGSYPLQRYLNLPG